MCAACDSCRGRPGQEDCRGSSGWRVYTAKNAVELVQAVTRLAADHALRKSLGNNGRRCILKHFSRQQTAIAYLDVCRKM